LGQNACGQGTSSEKNINVKVCTGIDDNKTEPEIRIYPNPTENSLNIGITNETRTPDYFSP